MFCVESYNKVTGERRKSDIVFDTKEEAEHASGELNSMEGRKTDGVVYVIFSAVEIKQ